LEITVTVFIGYFSLVVVGGVFLFWLEFIVGKTSNLNAILEDDDALMLLFFLKATFSYCFSWNFTTYIENV